MPRDLFNRTPMLTGTDPDTARRLIGNYFHAAFDRYETLFETLKSDEAYFVKPITLRHPLIFYLGHTATFFINKLTLAGLVESRINPRFESIFAIGVDEMSWDDLNDAHYEWPGVDEVRAYRDRVREVVSKVIRTAPLTLPIDWNSPWWAIVMGIEHELIHLETSSVLIRQHELQYVKPHVAWQPCKQSGVTPVNDLVGVEAGAVKSGKDKTDPYYGWDNEYGNRETELSAFEAGRYLVSNQEFLGFMEAGGYGSDQFWAEEGRAWKAFTHASHPCFWIKGADGWILRLMTEEVPMPWDWPVEVNYHEAKAFCNWKKAETGRPYRLPTEDEWYRLHDVSGASEIPHDQPATANIHLDHFASSCPVTAFPQGDFFDVTGNVWQWTETPIYPFDGFDVHPWYDDFSTPTFDDRHNLIKGGSWISCGNESRCSSRYGFRRHFFQHAGFRYVVSNGSTTVPNSQYETDKLLSEYAEFHYGDDYFGVPNFSKSLVDLVIKAMGDRPARKALDLGCAAGRAAFELARHFDHVDGVDFSARFIGLGVKLAGQGVLRYSLADEGDLVFYKERKLADFGLDGVRTKVAFSQGDACNLKPIHTGYDLIFAANLIDRLYNPIKFLTTVHERLNPGGLLLVASPYTWMEEHTKREEWIGGFKKNGERFTTFDGLNALLGPRFKLINGPLEAPFVIRETRRKFQHTISEVTIWERIT